jgi:DNA-binding NarL/FixJ family response regulator
VEDNEGIREAMSLLLDLQPGLRCSTTFTSAEEMLEALRRGPAPDVILSDLNLPGCSGVDSISQVRLLAPETPVVILTTFYDGSLETAAVCAGAAGFLTKSCGVEELVGVIRRAAAGLKTGRTGNDRRRISVKYVPAAPRGGPWGARAFGILRAAMGLG